MAFEYNSFLSFWWVQFCANALVANKGCDCSHSRTQTQTQTQEDQPCCAERPGFSFGLLNRSESRQTWVYLKFPSRKNKWFSCWRSVCAKWLICLKALGDLDRGRRLQQAFIWKPDYGNLLFKKSRDISAASFLPMSPAVLWHLSPLIRNIIWSIYMRSYTKLLV